MDGNIVTEEAFEETEALVQGNTHGDGEWEDQMCEFIDSDNDVDDDQFNLHTNATERISVGFNVDPDMEEISDYYPSSEELETDYDSDEDPKVRFPHFDAEKEMRNPILETGKTFKDNIEFRKVICSYGVVNRRAVRLKVNDSKRAQGVCKGDCPWKIWASWNGSIGAFQVKSYNSQHTCLRVSTSRHCTYKYLAEKYLERFTVDRDWKTSNFRQTVKDDMELKINRITAWRARKHAKLLIEGTVEYQFGLLRSYAAEVLRSAPGSTVIIAVSNLKFQGIYICLEACKKGFVAGCRRLIGLDGCFLKGSFGGQLLSAVGIDANDCIYLVAYAVVEKENTATWSWFVRLLGEDIGIRNSHDWTFMSDKQKGLVSVIASRYPDTEHRFCVRHLYSNFFRAEFKGVVLKDYFWRAAKSTTVADFRFWLEQIKGVSEEAYKWLMDRPAEQWSKSHFSTASGSDVCLNNLCECFNKMILEDREKCILTMLIDIHISFMKRIQSRRDKMIQTSEPICPKIMKRLNKNIEYVGGCEVDWSGGPQFYVRCASGAFVVDLSAHTCACRRWDLTEIPCSHAIAAIKLRRDDPLTYVSDCYKVQTYLSCYENILNPINGKKLWPIVDAPAIKPPGWELPRRGRKQKKRRKQLEEASTASGSTTTLRRKGHVKMTCSICGEIGHNKRYHNRPDAPNEDWYQQPTNIPVEDICSQPGNVSKLRPRRANSSQATALEGHDSSFSCPP